MAGLEDLYREIILDHYRSPRNRGELPAPPAHRVEGFNPLCGDEIVVTLIVEGDVVSDIKIAGTGCSISQSSASLMSAAVKGKPVAEVRDLIRPQEPKRVKIEDIQRVVARQYNVSRSDLLSSRRTANVVRPRQVAMYLAKTLTLRSLPEIGRRFGGRDHTTVLHAVRKIEGLVGNDMALAEEIEILKRQLQE